MRALFGLALAFVLAACSAPAPAPAPQPHDTPPAVNQPQKESDTPVFEAGPAHGDLMPTSSTEIATFGAGCYWCVEAVYQRIDGVTKVRSGFTGGTVPNPTYTQACSGTTGHAEAVEITFDPKKVTYETLLDWFWRLHDPTKLNRQGADSGTQYRSAIFWHSDAQRAAAQMSMKAAQESFDDPIVTEIAKAGPFYEAEAYHQNYYNSNSSQGYCQIVIAPKLKKLGLPK